MSVQGSGALCWYMYHGVETADILGDEGRPSPCAQSEGVISEGGVEPEANLSVSSWKGNIDEM